jgi:hypothetical protein
MSVVKSDVNGHCPFCRRDVSVRWGNPPNDPGHLFHALPTCDQFNRMTADQFVRAVIAGKHKN